MYLFEPPKHPHEPSHEAVPGLNICVACEDMEIGQLLINGPSKPYNLGWFDRVNDCKVCDVCRIVARGLKQDKLYYETKSHNSDYGSFIIVECVANIYPVPTVRSARSYELSFILIDGKNHQQLKASATLRLSGTSAMRQAVYPSYRARKIDAKAANLKQARDWLDECCKTHDQCHLNLRIGSPTQSHSSRVNPAQLRKQPSWDGCYDGRFVPFDSQSGAAQDMLRVIDIQDMNLCTIPWEENYLALSYVWPRFDYLCLLRANFAKLHLPGALLNLMDELPKVIKDALDVVRRLNERFLWIDALCIIQDDDNDKDTLVKAMDRVYGGSLLTLLVTTSTPAQKDYGIPGINKTPRLPSQESIEVDGLKLTLALGSIDSAIASSVWFTRGWTFQESILSRRCLVLSDHQLYFRCPRDYRCEDVITEGAPPHVAHPAKPSIRQNGQNRLDYLLREACFGKASEEDIFPEYSLLVSQYTPRRFTNSSDILNGFIGILKTLSPYIPDPKPFLFGHPLHAFDSALLWFPTSRLKRRLTSGTQFPSWSWSGWEGSVAYERDPPNITNASFVAWWWRCNERIMPARNYSNYLKQDNEFAHGILLAKAQDMTASQLIFWGISIDLTVGKEESHISHFVTDEDQTLPCFPLYDHEGNSCGFLPSADRAWAEEHRQSTQAEYEFLVLSAAARSPLESTQERTKWFHQKYKPRIVRTDLRDSIFCTYYNVMLLTYDKDGIAYRGGIGRIHKDAIHWDETATKIIILG